MSPRPVERRRVDVVLRYPDGAQQVLEVDESLPRQLVAERGVGGGELRRRQAVEPSGLARSLPPTASAVPREPSPTGLVRL